MRRYVALLMQGMKTVRSKGDGAPSLRKPPLPSTLRRPIISNRRPEGGSNNNAAVSSITQGLKRVTLSSESERSRFTRPKSTSARFYSVPANGCNSLEDVAAYLIGKNVRNIVALVGAGISTASGIPDFRTPGTGLYDNLQAYNIPYPEAIFDLDFFYMNHKPFFALARELYPNGRYRPNLVHYFLRLLHEKGLLLRIYTQNIDGLERLAGIPPEKLVEAHGTFATASCTDCGHQYRGVEVKRAVDKEMTPRCTSGMCRGVVKPDIVFFGENLPRRFWLHINDLSRADLLFVMGTSLEVAPFNEIVDKTRMQIPRILFNREAVGPFRKKRRPSDVVAEGDLMESVNRFSTILGWQDDLTQLSARHETAHRGKIDDDIIGGKPLPMRPKSNNGNARNYSTRSGASSAGSTLPRIANAYRPPPSYVRHWQRRRGAPVASSSDSDDDTTSDSSEESSDSDN